ncbi:MAG: 16S rRNA (adenine(1518)-N(6)/adenine(1519)-N(6))-dimethyltransferase RsmA [Acidobacteriota bacterium]
MSVVTRPRSPHNQPHSRRKRLGQHFLVPRWADRVVAAIAPQPGDVFLEIGPGEGALTLPIDRGLVETLARRAPPNVTVMSADVLEIDAVALLGGLGPQQPLRPGAAPPPPRRVRVVGNLPYAIVSPILFRLLEIHRRHGIIADATIMVQREVADRMTARPRSKNYGVLTITLALHTKITGLLQLPPGAFLPPPKVHSSVVRLEFGPPRVWVPDEPLFERMVKAMFSHRRKTLANGLKSFHPAAAAVLERAGIDGRRRPETLELSEIARLSELFSSADRLPVL